MTKEDASQIVNDAKLLKLALETQLTESLTESITNQLVRNTLAEMEDFDNEGEMEEDLDEIFDLSQITEEEDPMDDAPSEEGDMEVGGDEGEMEQPEAPEGGGLSETDKQDIIDAVVTAMKQIVGSPAETVDSTELPQDETPLDEADEAILEGILAEIDGTSQTDEVAKLKEANKELTSALNEALKAITSANAIKSLMKESTLTNDQLLKVSKQFDAMKDANAVTTAYKMLKETYDVKVVAKVKAKSTSINESKSIKPINSNKAPKQVALNESKDPWIARMKEVQSKLNRYN